MYRAYIIQRELEKLRRERDRREPLVLELPVPVYRPEVEEDDSSRDEAPRGVVIIDMNDYSEVED